MMITVEEIHRLEGIRCEAGIVSLTLKIDPRLMDHADQALKKYKGEVKRFLRQATSERERLAIERENDRIVQFLHDWRPTGRGLAIFAARPVGLFEAHTLDVMLPTTLAVDPSPHTALLLQVLSEHPRFVVVTIQRDQATIYVSERRQADKKSVIESEVQGWHSQGGWAQGRFQRHIEYQVRDHMKKVLEDLDRLARTTAFDRLAIGGTEQTTGELIRLLPESIAARIIGTFPIDHKHDTEDMILEKARALNEAFERQQEKELVEQICNASQAVLKQGVLGLEQTLQSLIEGRVQKLVVTPGNPCAGAECLDCGYLSAETFAACPACGGRGEPTSDIVDNAAERALRGGVKVDVVFGEAREQLKAQGGIGALLRYVKGEPATGTAPTGS